ncbi:DNA polymerase epsilon subunit 1 [Nematocida homosporus]|uniref:DNA polymerase epsilon subunit 1 n=1 Tax=Nematocida homosporus TaxID=1912981 RepID=UPI002220C9AE|nr:DNA polymerase epsilon subunit 1 [Nematocida homosporus]KAI5184513.1 DNA polymerase epsilon subunit 1 [Nematocida homosporus]
MENPKLSEYFGYDQFMDFGSRDGWLLNYLVKEKLCPELNRAITFGVLYFVDPDGRNFRVETIFYPQIIISVEEGQETTAEEYLKQKHNNHIYQINPILKTNLQEPNHLSPKPTKPVRHFLAIQCYTESDAQTLKREIDEIVKRNRQKRLDRSAVLLFSKEARINSEVDPETSILDIHEYDISASVQMAITRDFNAGAWYTVEYKGEYVITKSSRVLPPELRILTYDIETTKDPLKFPDAEKDKVMMISIMSNTIGWLIVNREIVSADIDPFEFRPTKDIGGEFEIFNEAKEKDLLLRFLEIIHTYKPHVISSYNGDFFDWPFLDKRLEKHDISLTTATGVYKNTRGEYLCDFFLHLDCFKWVKRDSYLPAGSQGLKSVTKAKLGYFPDEIDPENMVLFASIKPKVLASYSVSDAIATHFLYLKYVHPFIFSLASLIPLCPDDILRKGSGALCETLLMKEAFLCHVLIPAKKKTKLLYNYNGQAAESLSYVGGHVECLKSGVFRSDFEYDFVFNEAYLRMMIQKIDKIIDMELNGKVATNRVEVKQEIEAALESLIQQGNCKLKPYIYHLDVGAMYPNIILTNRLQPVAIVDDKICAQCIYYPEKETCQRKMVWKVRAEVYPVDEKTVKSITKKIKEDKKPSDISPEQRLKDALVAYSKRFYKKTREVVIEDKTSTVCQKENPFYVNAVRRFRDRRNEYKKLAKQAKGQAQEALSAQSLINGESANDLFKKAAVYDSLQIAHKCVLNSFYGYVMKKGARWYSMEMAAVVCQTGSSIIQRTKAVIDAFGITLELDTDGIWALLPQGFPLSYTLKSESGPVYFSYICSVLNHMLLEEFSNHQYQDQGPSGQYSIQTANSIGFEIDGPYRAMFLPGSAKEGESIKKRYIVINSKEKISEIKGFEFKRRGELKFVKAFQEDFFNTLLAGTTLEECYNALAQCAKYWIGIIEKKGGPLNQEEIFEYFGETRSMSKDAHEYAAVKSTCLTAAGRLAELLGQDLSTKGVSCSFIVSKYPVGEPVTSRAIPQSVFYTQKSTRDKYLKKWLQAAVVPANIKDIIDWDYYMERLSNVITKIIIVPSALQSIKNPLPNIAAPQWTIQHRKILGFLHKKSTRFEPSINQDISNQDIINQENLPIPAKSQSTPESSQLSPPEKAIIGKTRLSDYFQTKNTTSVSLLPPATTTTTTTNPTIMIKNVTAYSFTKVSFKASKVQEETVPLQKTFYLQAPPAVLDRLMATYTTRSKQEIEVSRLTRVVLGKSGQQELLKMSVNSEEFHVNFHKYTELFESPEIHQIVELDVPPIIRAIETIGYNQPPVIYAAITSIGEIIHCALSGPTTQLFTSKEELQTHLNQLPPTVIFTSKFKKLSVFNSKKFLVIPLDLTVPKAINNHQIANSLFEVLHKVQTRAEEILDICAFARIPLLELPYQSLPGLALDFLHYKERLKRDIIGWGEATSQPSIHYTLASPYLSPFKKEFHQEGIYEGFSISLHLSGTILLGVIESELLLKEENVLTKQTLEMQVMLSLMKSLVHGYILKTPGAQYLVNKIANWCTYPTKESTITSQVALEISLLQTKFISGIIRAIKFSNSQVIQTDHEDIIIHTNQSTQALAEAQLQSTLQEINSLEYGSLLNLSQGTWFKRVIMIDKTNYQLTFLNDKVKESFTHPIPTIILNDIITGDIISALEYLQHTYLENSKAGVLLARLLIKIYSLKFDEASFAKKAANIVHLNPFSYELTKPFGAYTSLTLICNCTGSTTFYFPLVPTPSAKAIDDHFDHLIRHQQKLHLTCSRCLTPFTREELEARVLAQITEEAINAIKSERKCTRCKRPAPGLITTRCSCGGRFDKNYKKIFFETTAHIISLASFIPTAASLTQARKLTHYLSVSIVPQ